MNKTGKRVLIGAIIVALVGGGAGGAYYLAKSRKSTPVSVYSMNDIGMDGYWGDEKQMSGRVTADKIQSVYVSTTQIIQEIMVEEGQEVHVGDPLMSYDTTLTSLQLDSKALEVQKLELSIQKAQEELKKIQSYKPGVPVSSSGTGKKIAMQTGGESVFQTAGIQALGTEAGQLVRRWQCAEEPGGTDGGKSGPIGAGDSRADRTIGNRTDAADGDGTDTARDTCADTADGTGDARTDTTDGTGDSGSHAADDPGASGSRSTDFRKGHRYGTDACHLSLERGSGDFSFTVAVSAEWQGGCQSGIDGARW